LVDGGEEVFSQLGGEGADAVEVGGCGVWGEAAEEVAGERGLVGMKVGRGRGKVQGAVELGVCCHVDVWGF